MISTQLGGELIPPLTQGEFSFQIEMPEGTPIERTDAVVRDVETEVSKIPAVETVFSSVGGSQKNQFATGVLEENFAQLYVVMKNRRDRLPNSTSINEVRGVTGSLSRRSSHTFSRPTLFSFKTPVEVEIFAFDLDEQRAAADKVAQMLAGDPRTERHSVNHRIGKPRGADPLRPRAAGALRAR